MSGYNDLIRNAAGVSKRVSDAVTYNKRPENGQNQPETGNSFGTVLRDRLSEMQPQPISFSKHAAIRLNSRAISLSDEQLKRVEGGLANASQKGIKDSLVLIDDLALLVNVPSRTVITAMNQNSKNVFTNIDGAVIV